MQYVARAIANWILIQINDLSNLHFTGWLAQHVFVPVFLDYSICSRPTIFHLTCAAVTSSLFPPKPWS